MILDTASKQIVRFGHVGWEGLPKGAGWTRSGRLVLFEFQNNPDRLDLRLYVGPGPAEVRQRVIDIAMAHRPPFLVQGRNTSEPRKFKSIYLRRFLRPEDYQDAAHGEIEARIRAQWDEFADRDLPVLIAPIQEVADSIATSRADGEAISETTAGSADETVQDQQTFPGVT